MFATDIIKFVNARLPASTRIKPLFLEPFERLKCSEELKKRVAMDRLECHLRAVDTVPGTARRELVGNLIINARGFEVFGTRYESAPKQIEARRALVLLDSPHSACDSRTMDFMDSP